MNILKKAIKISWKVHEDNLLKNFPSLLSFPSFFQCRKELFLIAIWKKSENGTKWPPYASCFVLFFWLHSHIYTHLVFLELVAFSYLGIMNNARPEFAIVQFMRWKCCTRRIRVLHMKSRSLERIHLFLIYHATWWRVHNLNKKKKNHSIMPQIILLHYKILKKCFIFFQIYDVFPTKYFFFTCV